MFSMNPVHLPYETRITTRLNQANFLIIGKENDGRQGLTRSIVHSK